MFGLGLGFASYVTVIPLFMASLTDSSILIGLIAAMRAIGWQLPQLLTSNRVARIRRYKPMSLLMTLNERLPFFGLALVALALPTIGKQATLTADLYLRRLADDGRRPDWDGLAKHDRQDHPANLARNAFTARNPRSANLLSSGGAIIAGLILQGGQTPANFALCFLLAAIAMMIGFGLLYADARTGRPARPRNLAHAARILARAGRHPAP